LIGLLPKRRCEIVTPPDFLESYWKYACTFMSVWSPMILMEFLFAPTVPSEPRPQNLQEIVSAGVMSTSSLMGMERFVTSSTMPMVKWFFGRSLPSSSKMPLTMAGLNSLEERP